MSTRKLSKSSAASSPRGIAFRTGPNQTVPSTWIVGVPTYPSCSGSLPRSWLRATWSS